MTQLHKRLDQYSEKEKGRIRRSTILQIVEHFGVSASKASSLRVRFDEGKIPHKRRRFESGLGYKQRLKAASEKREAYRIMKEINRTRKNGTYLQYLRGVGLIK